jgi:hypothetical protein
LKITFSAHAEQRMAERHITKKQVIEALTPPTNITPGKGERLVAKKNKVRVVHVVKPNEIVVVTVTWE